MKKNCFAIGISIIAIVLLVLSSLSNVVGYQSVKSTMVNDSPLFKTRTKKATNQQQNIMTFQYLGIGKENILQFPIRDNRTEHLMKTIEIISKMDDRTFARFTELYIQQARKDSTLGERDPNEIVQILQLLRAKQKTIINSPNSVDVPTICYWFPGCIIYMFMAGLIAIIVVFSYVLYTILHPTENIACRSVVLC